MNGKQQREALASGQPVLEGPESVRMVPINKHQPGTKRMPYLLVEMMAGMLNSGIEFEVSVSSEFPNYDGKYFAMITWGTLLGKKLESCTCKEGK